jgi:CRISPR-associated protein Cas1
MKKLLNTLYVTSPDAYIGRDGDNVVVKIGDDQKTTRMPIHLLESIICFGYAGASPSLMQLCCDKGVSLSFFTEHGKFMGRVYGPISGNILLRKKQFIWATDEMISLRLAKRFILAKLLNTRSVLRRALRDHPSVHQDGSVEKVMMQVSSLIKQIDRTTNADELRGIEGLSAQRYFGVLSYMILSQKKDFLMRGRTRRPPMDRMNALLSFLYTLLTHDMVGALESVGLDPQAGFLHQARPGRPSLALDMIEELRLHMADRLAITLVNRQQVKASDFIITEAGAVTMTDKNRKEILLAWQKRKKEEIIHPFLKEKIQIGLIPYVQAMLMARHIRGDIEDYPPFIWS